MTTSRPFRLLVVSVSLTFCSLTAYSAPTINEAVRQAIETHPEVDVRWREFLAAGFGTNAAKAGYLPSVDLATGYNYQQLNYGPKREFGSGFARIGLTQMLYDGSRTRSEVSRLSHEQLVSYFRLLETIENIGFEAFKAYQDVLKHRQLVNLAEDNLQKHYTVYKQIEDSVIAGRSRAADLEQITGRLSLAQSNLMIEASNLHDVTARYLRLTGQAPSSDMRTAALEISTPQKLSEALNQSYQFSPAYHAALRNIEAAEAAHSTARANFKPQVSLNSSYTYRDTDQFGFKSDRSEAQIGIEVRYNLFSGKRDTANAKKAIEEINIAKDLRLKACIDIRQNMQIAFNENQRLVKQIPFLSQHRISSDRVRTAYKQQFDIGQRSLLDVLDSENEFFQASRAWLIAEAENLVSQARILATSGKLIEALSLSRNALPSLADLGAQPITVDPASACPVDFAYDTSIYNTDSDQDGVPDYLDFCPNTPAGTSVDARGCSVSQPIAEQATAAVKLDIHFSHNSSELPDDAAAILQQIAAHMQSNPELSVEIAGHTSLDGSDWYNRLLSQQRADAIRTSLIAQHKIPAARVIAVGYGSSQLAVEGNTEAARQANRRVEARFKTP
ncbi:TolC family outer membrane protein [Arsukibacterium sp.]|uniref:TolC family outer membrane protein n=1 Tax=Arsukibacterium sp. TaxID=1977258 RepID=UPI002FDAE0CB